MDVSGHTWPMVLGAAVISAGLWGYDEITSTRDRVDVIELQREAEAEEDKQATKVRHDREIEHVRELVELRTTVEVQSRLLVDVLNEVRELRGKPATSFSKATEDARQRAERGE